MVQIHEECLLLTIGARVTAECEYQSWDGNVMGYVKRQEADSMAGRH